jgi:hypothetical protein
VTARRSRLLLYLSTGALFAIAASWGVKSCRLAPSLGLSPSSRRARASVEQIVFVRGRVLVANELGELFGSDDGGASWRALRGHPGTLAVANGGELWGAKGWPGHHEDPSAEIWFSDDRGDSWSNKDLELPEPRHKVHAHLPGAFLQEPANPPLLAMWTRQLVRPEVTSKPSTWKRVGTIPDAALSPSGGAAGLEYRGSIYLAVLGHIFLSRDQAQTWDRRDVSFMKAQIRCHADTCHALLDELGGAVDGLVTAAAGTNDWTPVTSFAPATVAPALTSDGRHASIERFGATAIVARDDGVYVAGIVHTGKESWGAVLRVDRAGAVTMVGHGVPDGLWVLEQAPDGTLWTGGGQGAYRLQAGEWVRTWSAASGSP